MKARQMKIAFLVSCLFCAVCAFAETQSKTITFGDLDEASSYTFEDYTQVEEIILEGAVGHIDGYTITDFPNLKRIIFRGPINTTGGAQFVKDCPNLEEVRFEGLVMKTGFGEPINCPKLKEYTITGAVVTANEPQWMPTTSFKEILKQPKMVEQLKQLAEWQIKRLENKPEDFFYVRMILRTEEDTRTLLKKAKMRTLARQLEDAIEDIAYPEPEDPRPKLEILKDSPAYKADSAVVSFQYAAPTDSLLTLTRNHYNLDSVAGSGDDISKIKNLLYWVHDLIPHNGGADWPKCNFNVRELEQAGKENGLNCRFMAFMLTEALLAEGIPARYVTCESKAWSTDSDCHVICVAWSESLGKWVWVDPTFAAYVTDENGIMLHPGEVRYRLQHDLPLIINEDANWNHESKVDQNYLEQYMAKNLYIMSCNMLNQSQPEGKSTNAKGQFVALVPEGSDYTNAHVITTDEEKFWQAPTVDKQ